ncbi:MAG: winged helix-turn-helix domain-containing protein [Salibacteraceae bacterium]
MSNKYHIKARFWIEGEEATFLGEGRVRLLKAIEETGSISAAAKLLEISYRKAWKMIDIMNSQAKSPLVERQTGGKSGGGTVVTPQGVNAMNNYWAFKTKCNNYIEQTFKEFEF